MGLSDLNFASGLQDGMNSGLRLLEAVEGRKDRETQRERDVTTWKQQQDDRSYQVETLRPLQERSTRLGLAGLEDQHKWGREDRDYTTQTLRPLEEKRARLGLRELENNQDWQQQTRQWDKEDRPLQKEQNRWAFGQLKSAEARTQAEARRNQQAQNNTQAQQYMQAGIQALTTGDKDSADKAFREAAALNPAVGYMLQGQYTAKAGAFRDFTLGKRSADDPEVQEAVKLLMQPSMTTSGRDKDYEAAGFEKLEGGQYAFKMKPRFGGKYSDVIDAQAKAQGVDADFIRAVIGQESAGNPNAVSNKNAGGLMQLIPATFDAMAKELGIKNADRFNPEHNVATGTLYLKKQLQKYGSPELALAAYNAGPGAVDKYKGIPPFKETQAYVPKIMQNYKQLKQGVPATHGMSSEPDDPLVTLTAEDGISGYQTLMTSERELQNLMKQAGYAYTALAGVPAASGKAAAATSPKQWNKLDDGTLYNEYTGETKTVKGGAEADTGRRSLLDRYGKDGEEDPAWKAKAIERDFPEMPYPEREALLGELNGMDDPVKVEQRLKGAKTARDVAELSADLVSGAEIDPQIMEIDPAGAQALMQLSAEVKALGLPPETVQSEVKDAADKVGSDYEVLLPYLQKRLQVLKMERERQAKQEKKLGESLDTDQALPVGSMGAMF